MGKLRILLANNTLSLLAGSETWTYTLALALKKLGHDVACYSPSLGIISERLYKNGILSYDDLSAGEIKMFTPVLSQEVTHEYDVIIANHHHIVAAMRSRFPKTPIISTIHGIIHFHEDNTTWAPEHPAQDSGVGQFVAVSEEVQQLLRGQYSIDSVIVRNFIDVSRFNTISAPQEEPKQFFVNTNYSDRNDPIITLIRDTAKIMGARVTAIGANFTSTFEIERPIKDSDVVFGMGRSVLEGMAAGRLGVVLGRWGFGGVITEGNYKEIRACNFSGRNAEDGAELPTPEELADLIKQAYQPAILDWSKQYIARDHNAAFAAEEFVRIAEDITGRSINASRPTGMHPDAEPLKKSYE